MANDPTTASRSGRLRRSWDHVVHPRRRGHGTRLLVALVLLLLSAVPLERDSVSNFEKEIFEWLNGLPDALNGPVQVVMQLGNWLAVPVIGLLVLAIFKEWRVAIDLAIAGTAAWLIARVVKEMVERGRPGDLLSDVILRDAPESGLGFVSGHTAVAAALATVAAAYLGVRWKIVVIVLAVLVGLSRIYVGAHLPLDVVGGAMMGWAIGSLIHFFVLPKVTGEDVDDLADAD
jgi:glycosyltransferase 2 family protein